VAAGVNLPPAAQPPANGTYRLRNRASGKYLDNLGATTDGANVAQWAGGSSPNQRWVLTTSGGFSKLRCLTGGKYLDSIGRTADGSNVGQWASGSSPNQQWTVVATGSYYKVINRANGKALDTGGQTGDGNVMQFWFDNTSNNQQWTFEFVSSSTSLASSSAVSSATRAQSSGTAREVTGLPRTLTYAHDPRARALTIALPGGGEQRVMLVGRNGLVWAEATASGDTQTLSTAEIPAGPYKLRVIGADGAVIEKDLLIRP
jgi:hypothetical protein